MLFKDHYKDTNACLYFGHNGIMIASIAENISNTLTMGLYN